MYQDYEKFPCKWYSEGYFDEDTFDKIAEYGNMCEEDREMCDAFNEHYGEDYPLDEIRQRFHGKWDSEVEYAEQLPEFARRYFDIEQFASDLFAYDYSFVDGYVFSDYLKKPSFGGLFHTNVYSIVYKSLK